MTYKKIISTIYCLKNAEKHNKPTILVQFSNNILQLLKILYINGFINGFQIEKSYIRIFLKLKTAQCLFNKIIHYKILNKNNKAFQIYKAGQTGLALHIETTSSVGLKKHIITHRVCSMKPILTIF